MPSTKKVPNRRKDGKNKMCKELDDIICLMKSTCSDVFPVFVAKDLHKIPPVSFDHVDATRILKDILALQNRINALEEKYVTVEKFEALEQHIENMQHASLINHSPVEVNVNRRRGAYLLHDSFTMDSGPIGLQYQQIKAVNTSQSFVNKRSSSKTSLNDETNCAGGLQKYRSSKAGQFEAQANLTAVSNSASKTDHSGRRASVGPASEKETELMRGAKTHTAVSQDGGSVCAVSPTSGIDGAASFEFSVTDTEKCGGTVVRERVLSDLCEQVVRETNKVDEHKRECAKKFSDLVRNGKWKEEKPTDDWILVQRKRLRNRFIGRKGNAEVVPDCKFKAAETKIPFYIYNIDKSSTVADITNYIKTKTGVEVQLQKVNMKLDKQYVAYNFLIPKKKLATFLDENLWSSGVLFRKFLRFNRNSLEQQARSRNSLSQK